MKRKEQAEKKRKEQAEKNRLERKEQDEQCKHDQQGIGKDVRNGFCCFGCSK
jgi:hypothetical protein